MENVTENPDECLKPPEGWYCPRKKGHSGPCAAHPQRNWGEFLSECLTRPRVSYRVYRDGKSRRPTIHRFDIKNGDSVQAALRDNITHGNGLYGYLTRKGR